MVTTPENEFYRTRRAVLLACVAIDPAISRPEQLRRIAEILALLGSLGSE